MLHTLEMMLVNSGIRIIAIGDEMSVIDEFQLKGYNEWEWKLMGL